VETPRSGAALLLTVAVVLRAVALALEPLRRLALRYPAPEVDALLVERGVAGLHAGQLLVVDVAGRGQGGLGVLGDPHPPLGVVGEAGALFDLGVDRGG